MQLFQHWRQDAQSSLVVFLVALPLCLGIALASNAPLASGIFAGIIGGIVVGALSGSHISVSGPAAGLTIIVISSLQQMGGFESFAVAVFLSGVFQLLFGVLRFGGIGNYFPISVIKGMLAAIGIILILKQFPHAIGYDVDFMGDESFEEASGENTFSQIIRSISMLREGALVIALASFGLIQLWEKLATKFGGWFKLIPGALVAVVFSVVLNETFGLIEKEHLVSLPFDGGIKSFFAAFTLPNWDAVNNITTYKVAFTIALVGSLESLLSVEAADKIDTRGRITNKDRELVAQGIGNSLSGLIGGLPITAVIVRTSANASAGAVTRLSAILHGILLALCAMFIPLILNKIPLATLAVVLILVGYKLTKPELIKKMYANGMNQFIPFTVTILAILFTDLLTGIMIGTVVGFIFVIRANLNKSIVMVENGNDYLIKFYKDVSFLQKNTLSKMLNSVPSNSSVMIDGASGISVDADIEDVIEEFMKKASASNIQLTLKKSTLAQSRLFKD